MVPQFSSFLQRGLAERERQIKKKKERKKRD
jgi:hypothetical protein